MNRSLTLPLTFVLAALLSVTAVADIRRDDYAAPVWRQPAGLRGQDSPLLLAKRWEDLTPEEKERVKEAKERYKNLPDDKKERLRKKWENMPKDEKEKYKLERRYRQ